MAYLFTESGRARLAEVVKPGVLCAFDFDGTLAPIAPQPDQVHIRHGVLQRLNTLRRHAPVAVITGRSVEDARARMRFEPDYLIGNHGLEGVPGWNGHAAEYEKFCRQWRAELSERMGRGGLEPAIWLEDKRYSLSLHYRAAEHRSLAEKQLADLVATLRPKPRIIGGKCVLNLVPVDAPDKGQALAQLLRDSQCESAIYVGDDATDEDVFRLRDRSILTVRIGHAAHTAAAFFLDNRSEVAILLDELIVRLRGVHHQTKLDPAPVIDWMER